MPDEGLVILERCYDLTQAHIIRGLLETNNIPCFLMDENHTAMAWHLSFAIGGARVMVHQRDFDKAHYLLAEAKQNESSEDATPLMKRSLTHNIANFFLGLFGLIFSGLPLVMPDKGKKNE